jgi:pyruvate-formate lyase-activating enzyme
MEIFSKYFSGLRVMERTRNVDFLALDLKEWDSNPIIALCTSSHNWDHLCQVIKKYFSGLKVIERTRN